MKQTHSIVDSNIYDKICAMDIKLKKLKEDLVKEKLDAVLISSVESIIYLSGFSNFSKEEREAYILVGRDFEYIITDGRYSEAVLKNVPHLTLFERGGKKTTEDLFKKHKKDIKRLGIEENNLTISEHKVVKKHFKNLKHFDLSSSRSIKDKDEIEKIKNAAKLADRAFNYVLKKIQKGISEKELAFELEYFIKKNGSEISFPTIVAFGKNSSIPHHQTGQAVLGEKQGQFVLVDMGAKYENYCSDMTRTIFLGEPSEKQKKIYRVVLSAQRKAVEFINERIKNGKEIRAKDVDKVAREYIIKQGYSSIPHSLGHGVGLEVHEDPHLSPKSKDVLRQGMIFSIEPGIYIEEFGGVRIEDLFVLEKDVLKQITTSPKNITQI